ncbi:MAG TPA: CoA transferase, partial [Burkholderiales bacterium]
VGRKDLLQAPEFKGGENRAKNRAALNAALNEALSRRTSREWVETLNGAGVPCGPIYSVDQVFADPQVQHLEAAAEVDHPLLGRLRVLSQAVRLSRTAAKVVAPAPELGQHTDEILKELRYSESDIRKMRERGTV